MRLFELVKEIDTQLAAVLPERHDRQSECRFILETLAGLTPETVLTHPDTLVSAKTAEAIATVLAQRCQDRQPLQYLLGHGWFFGHRFFVAPGVLIPRPETERLVEWALEILRSKSEPTCVSPDILDLGTGSGCIALSLKAALPQAQVFAADISPKALQIAQENAKLMDLSVTFCHGDWFEALKKFPNLPKFDVIVSNPPYIPPEEQESLAPELSWEPPESLFHPDPFVLYHALFKQAPAYLADGGSVLVELGSAQALAIMERLEQTLGLIYTFTVRPDLAGHPRMIEGHLHAGP